MEELETEIKELVDVHNRIYAWRQKGYDNPTVQPGYDRLSEALVKIANAIDILKCPMD